MDINFFKTEDNSTGLFSKNTNDIFHSKTGAVTEALEKFIDPVSILLKNKKKINVLDICYGIGYNSKALLNSFSQNHISIDILEFNIDYILMSPFILDGINNNALKYFLIKEIEKNFQIDVFYFFDNLKGYLNDNKVFFDAFISFLDNFCKKTPYTNNLGGENNRFLHNIYYNYISNRFNEVIDINKYTDCAINFHIGDARKTIFECINTYDVVFLDAFSPQKDPTLWTIDFLSIVTKLMNKDAILVSYSKSTPFRNALKQLGFCIGKTFINNVDMGTVASFNKSNIINPLTEYDYELLKTRSGITYKDPNLNFSPMEILKYREAEQKSSNLVSHTQFLKSHLK